jgi:hypothetical protein
MQVRDVLEPEPRKLAIEPERAILKEEIRALSFREDVFHHHRLNHALKVHSNFI